jgi:regulator of sirC expression with transglutaminase-like and TPR domain
MVGGMRAGPTEEGGVSCVDLTAPLPSSGGLGFVGAEVYYKPQNSDIFAVLRGGEGIPITLAIIHHAVGARCGVPIDMAVSCRLIQIRCPISNRPLNCPFTPKLAGS